jgi:O-antigen ligase
MLLLLLVVAGPLPYGGIMPAGAMRIELLCFAAGAVAVLANRGHAPLPRLPLAALGAIAVVGILQLVPLPLSALESISPASAAVYRDTNRALELLDQPPVEPRISIAPSETVRATLLIAGYTFAFIAGVYLTRRRWQRSTLLAVLLINALGHVFYAAIFQTDAPRMHGTFVNANHFAGYLQISLAFAFALVWIQITRPEYRAPDEDSASRMERRLIGLAWRVLAWVAVAAGIGFTLSRLGITAAAISTVLALTLAIIHRRGRSYIRQGAIALGVLTFGLVVVILTVRDLPIVRFLAADPRDPQYDLRPRLWRIAIDAWTDFPHFGSGLGTFREAFRRSQPSDLNGLVEQAHSDSLQLLVTGGWISLILAAVALFTFAAMLMRRWWNRRGYEAAYAEAAFVALIALLLHGIAEFNFSIPAIPATLAVMLGAGWSAVHARSDERETG